KVKATRRFDKVVRDRAQRLIEAECHVPRLAREYGEDRRKLGPQDFPGRERHEENDGDRDETEDRDRLQDVEHRNENKLGAAALWREGRVGEGEQERQSDGG